MTKIKLLALFVGFAISGSAVAATSGSSLEARMAQLEQRLQQAEHGLKLPKNKSSS